MATKENFRIKNKLLNINMFPINKILVKSLITKIFAYSAIKINANIPLLYSTLNPETSSLSPSAKSNGVRLVSAILVMNQITPIGIIINPIQVNISIFKKSIEINKTKEERKIKVILTS